MKAERFKSVLAELIDENPFAIRAALKILDVCFTDGVPTLAVTCEERPRLLVNLGFVAAHCRSDAEVKAVICHEFLHVLLRHTEQRAPLTSAPVTEPTSSVAAVKATVGSVVSPITAKLLVAALVLPAASVALTLN